MISIRDAWENNSLPWLRDLVSHHQPQIDARMKNGDLRRWQQALESIPEISSSSATFGRAVGLKTIPEDTSYALETALRGLMPWRKGPFRFGNISVDAEWRSDLKWDRLTPHIDLSGQRVLDVGSGSGYHIWRMFDAGAEEVLGIDPSILSHCQFAAIKSLLGHPKAASLPLTLEQFSPRNLRFDTVFSMGVLYHRKDPITHIEQLKKWVSPGGQLVLETLVVDGDKNTCLVPPDRYARMNNVWFLPSIAMLTGWLKRLGFREIKCLDVSITTFEEQRETPWMQFESLEFAIDPKNALQTVEGLPRPTRAAMLATLPVK